MTLSADPRDNGSVTLAGELQVGMIWAQASNGVIGSDGTLAWHVPEDLRHFHDTTLGYAVLHGRLSYESLPAQVRPLPGRRNIVLTRQQDYRAPGTEVVGTLDQAFSLLDGDPVWICGGGEVYELAMEHADVLLVTELDLVVEGDTHAPTIDDTWHRVKESSWIASTSGVQYRFLEYRRVAASHHG